MAPVRRPHITPLRGARQVFLPGAALTNAVPITNDVFLAGHGRWRIRIKASVAGTLSAAYYRPGVTNTLYTANNPADVAVVAGTETLMEATQHMGEESMRVIFTPAANGTLTYCDVSAL